MLPSLPRPYPPPLLGSPRLDAAADFARARRAYLANRWLARGRERALRALDDAACVSGLPPRLRVVLLTDIIGTVEPTVDFDAGFRPATNRVAERWQRIARAHREGRVPPPITLAERPDGYYVIDGRHRVSVARALRRTDIDAWVTAAGTL